MAWSHHQTNDQAIGVILASESHQWPGPTITPVAWSYHDTNGLAPRNLTHLSHEKVAHAKSVQFV